MVKIVNNLSDLVENPNYEKEIREHTIDLHIHSHYSDGMDSVEELLEKIQQAGLKVFSLTDHDNVEGVKHLLSLMESGKVQTKEELLFIPGIEFSCKLSREEAMQHGLDLYDSAGAYRRCEFHILGYGMDLSHPDFLDAVRINRDARVKKVEERVQFLQEHGFPQLTEADAQRILAENPNPGKPHLVNLLEEKGLLQGRFTRQAIFDLLEQHHSHHPNITPEQAIRGITRAGGMAVLAHGVKGSGRDNFTYDEIQRRVRYLKELGLQGLECYYSPYEAQGYRNGFTPEQQAIMEDLARRFELVKTAGSDYHGANKPTVLLGRRPMPTWTEINVGRREE